LAPWCCQHAQNHFFDTRRAVNDPVHLQWGGPRGAPGQIGSQQEIVDFPGALYTDRTREIRLVALGNRRINPIEPHRSSHKGRRLTASPAKTGVLGNR
jgi:hypothetical protein